MHRTEHDKVAVVTGASSGIGAATARALIARGWHVIAVGRTRERLNATLREIRAAYPGARIDGLLANFESIKQVERVAQDIAALSRRVHVLVNNAGGICKRRRVTDDGFEALLAANHLGPYLLTRRLLPQLRAANGARIINVSSEAHKAVRDMIWDDLQLRRKFSPTRAYGQSKLATLLFTRELSQRVAGERITVNAMHPGIVASNFATHGGRFMSFFFGLLKPFAKSPAEGADTIVWLATAEEVAGKTGAYFIGRHEARMSVAARSDENAHRLWAVSERLLSGAKAGKEVLSWK